MTTGIVHRSLAAAASVFRKTGGHHLTAAVISDEGLQKWPRGIRSIACTAKFQSAFTGQAAAGTEPERQAR